MRAHEMESALRTRWRVIYRDWWRSSQGSPRSLGCSIIIVITIVIIIIIVINSYLRLKIQKLKKAKYLVTMQPVKWRS